MKFVVYTDENIKRNNEIIKQNTKVAAEILKPVMQKIVKNINESLKQLALMNQKRQ